MPALGLRKLDRPSSHEPEPRSGQSITLPVVLALATVYLVWGSTYLAIRIALDGFPPLALAATRFIVAGGILYLWLAARGAPQPTAREWMNALVAGTLLL